MSSIVFSLSRNKGFAQRVLGFWTSSGDEIILRYKHLSHISSLLKWLLWLVCELFEVKNFTVSRHGLEGGSRNCPNSCLLGPSLLQECLQIPLGQSQLC